MPVHTSPATPPALPVGLDLAVVHAVVDPCGAERVAEDTSGVDDGSGVDTFTHGGTHVEGADDAA